MSAAVLRPATRGDVPRLTEIARAAYGHYVARLGRPPRKPLAERGYRPASDAET